MSGEFLEGFALTAEIVVGLENKQFVIKEMPSYVEMPDLDHPGQKKRKLLLKIQLMQDQSLVDYYPNKSSQKVLAAKKSMTLANWVGFVGEFEVLDQMVGPQKKQVIYIKK